MIIPVGIHERNKSSLLQFNQKMYVKLESVDNLQLQFIDQPQSDIVVFAIINFQILSKWKHGIGTIDIIKFNEELEFISTSIIEIVNIDESLHENAIRIFITKRLK